MNISDSRKKQGRLRAFTALLLAAALLIGLPLTGAPANAASEKEEVVYVKLSNDGSVDGIYVVNSFEVGPGGQIIDYGNYEYVKNLTGTDAIALEGGVVTINTDSSRLYYEGFLSEAELPWLFSISYWLDGKKTDPDALGGASGSLRIEIESKQNPGGSQDFFDRFCLQVSVTMDSELCREIKAESGTVATSGGSKQISFVALPGKETKMEISAEVTDFELPAITIAGVTMNMDFDFEDVDMEDIRELMDGIAELDDGVQELLDGVFDLRDGVTDLHDGTGEFADGVTELEDGVKDLADGVKDLVDGVGELSDGTEEMVDGATELGDGVKDLVDGVTELDDGVGELLEGATEFRDGVGELLEGTDELYSGIQRLTEGVNELYSGMGELASGAAQAAGGGPELYAGFSAYFDGIIAMVNTQLEGTGAPELTRLNYETVLLELLYGTAVAQATEQIRAGVYAYRDDVLASVLFEAGLDTETYNALPAEDETRALIDRTVEDALEAMVRQQVDEMMEQIMAEAEAQGGELLSLLEMLKGYDALLAGLSTYVNGVSGVSSGISKTRSGVLDLYNGMKEYEEGMNEYHGGVFELYDGAKELADGILELKDGTFELLDGVIELKDGVVEFRDGVIELHDGVIELFDGVIELHDGVIELHDGVIELNDGAIELHDGTGELLDGVFDLYDGVFDLKDGTAELRDGTETLDKDIVDGIKDAVDEMMGAGGTDSSFVSDENGEVAALQFVMQTQGITLPEAPESEPEPEPELTLWQRFIALFGF